ncbi:MAG TPA: NUDIX domain-containing protein [Candidatus Bathyarchaeia archaeon]|nr:NUDIX domain-containing protein [Candidatus Bathyarchaeia archaeon]
MLEERSAGAILYRESSTGNLYLLLNYPSGHWDFVKGNIEKGEMVKETVVREIQEETGITDVNFVEGFEDKVEYHYQRDGQLVHKEVIFFLAKTKTENVKLSHEHHGFIWLDFNSALKKLTYKTAQNMLKKIKELGFNT